MFLAKNQSKSGSDYPTDSAIRESDWHILAGFWHPVAVAHTISLAPVSQTLLDVDLVLYRTNGSVTAAFNRCPHRGARLSDGTVEKEQLVCPMHGLHYNAAGACSLIPSVGNTGSAPPKSICLKTFQCAERYGLIWVCLKNKAIKPLPNWHQLEQPERNLVFMPPDNWATSAGRHVENFNDIAHFPWVHIDSFGGKKSDVFPPYDVQQSKDGLSFEVSYTEGGNRFPDGVSRKNRKVRYIFELSYPFSTLLHVDPLGSDFVHYFADSVCPVSADRSRIFQMYTDTTNYPDMYTWFDEAIIINAEDKPLVEGQSPKELPLNLRHDISVPVDRFSIEYRRGLVKHFGLGKPAEKSA